MSDKPMSNMPGRITASPEMLEAAVAELLRLIPETWQAYKPDDLSETRAQALFLLSVAGIVERRERLRLRMFNHPLVSEATIVFTGEYGGVEALESLTASLWADWQDAYRQWRQGEAGNAAFCHCERMEPLEWRLTDQGVIARKDLDAGGHDQGVVFDFVLKRGCFDGNPYEMPDGQVRRHEPIRGKGALLKLDKIKSEAAGTVNIGNWGTGGDAIAQAVGPVIAKMFEAMQGKAPATALPERSKEKPAARRGRPKVSEEEAERRQDILAKWQQASEAGVTREKFCHDKSITTRELEAFQRWARAREARKGTR